VGALVRVGEVIALTCADSFDSKPSFFSLMCFSNTFFGPLALEGTFPWLSAQLQLNYVLQFSEKRGTSASQMGKPIRSH